MTIFHWCAVCSELVVCCPSVTQSGSMLTVPCGHLVSVSTRQACFIECTTS